MCQMKSGGRYLYQLNPTVRAHEPLDAAVIAAQLDLMSDQDLATADINSGTVSVLRNNGDGSFTVVPLPTEAQFAPVYGVLASDVDGDGHTDLLLGGNFDGVPPVPGSAMPTHSKPLHVYYPRMVELQAEAVDIRVLTSIGNCYRKLKQFESGVPYFEKALAKEPDNFYALFGLADCYRGTARPNLSLDYWNRILAKDPRNKVILTRAGDAYRKHKEPLGALVADFLGRAALAR